MSVDERAQRLLKQAKEFAATGRTSEACVLLQSLLSSVGRGEEVRALRESAATGLIQILFAEGRMVRASKAFRHAVAEFCAVADAAFDEAYFAGCVATGTAPIPLRRRDRFLNLLHQLDQVRDHEGVVAECGCFRGLSSFLMCSRLRQHRPGFDGGGFQIYDSFQGLSESGPQDEPENPEDLEAKRVKAMNKPGSFAASLADVSRALSPFPRVDYFPGWIPDAFAADNPLPYRFVHVDVDLYQPTIDSFRYFWPRLLPGGRMVCDDYNWAGARRAVEEFCAEAGVSFDVTPNQQAYFVKPG